MRDAILDQAEVWVDKEGKEHRIAEMTGRYCLNVYSYLKSRAPVVGFRYGLYLISLPMPPEDSAAYDDVDAAVTREQERIGADPRAWLLDKPLMRALLARVAVDRIERSVGGYDYAADAELRTIEGMTPYEVPADAFAVRPQSDLDEQVYGQRPGDETRVFLVIESDYDSADNILGVFVGNRLAAYRFEVEANRYGRWNSEVQEFDDFANGGTPGMYGQIRKYRDPWTEVRLSAVVDLVTGEVTQGSVETVVRNDETPVFNTERENAGRRGHLKVRVTTSGPDTEWDRLRKLHASNVNRIRVNVLDDLTKDMP